MIQFEAKIAKNEQKSALQTAKNLQIKFAKNAARYCQNKQQWCLSKKG